MGIIYDKLKTGGMHHFSPFHWWRLKAENDGTPNYPPKSAQRRQPHGQKSGDFETLSFKVSIGMHIPHFRKWTENGQKSNQNLPWKEICNQWISRYTSFHSIFMSTHPIHLRNRSYSALHCSGERSRSDLSSPFWNQVETTNQSTRYITARLYHLHIFIIFNIYIIIHIHIGIHAYTYVTPIGFIHIPLCSGATGWRKSLVALDPWELSGSPLSTDWESKYS